METMLTDDEARALAETRLKKAVVAHKRTREELLAAIYDAAATRMRQQDIAELVGFSRQWVSKLVSDHRAEQMKQAC